MDPVFSELRQTQIACLTKLLKVFVTVLSMPGERMTCCKYSILHYSDHRGRTTPLAIKHLRLLSHKCESIFIRNTLALITSTNREEPCFTMEFKIKLITT